MSVLHAVHQKQEFVFIAELTQPQQILRCCSRDAAFALDRFNENCDGGWRNRVAHGLQFVEADMPKARRYWLEALLDFVLSGRRDSGERASVERIGHRKDF